MTPLANFYFHRTRNYYYAKGITVSCMPTVHIAESVFREYVDREGGYDEAKAKVKTVVREELQS